MRKRQSGFYSRNNLTVSILVLPCIFCCFIFFCTNCCKKERDEFAECFCGGPLNSFGECCCSCVKCCCEKFEECCKCLGVGCSSCGKGCCELLGECCKCLGECCNSFGKGCFELFKECGECCREGGCCC